MAWTKVLGYLRLRRLGTRAIMALLVLVLMLQALAVIGFVWERKERINPALQSFAAGEIIQSLQRIEFIPQNRRQGRGGIFGPRGTVIITTNRIEEENDAFTGRNPYDALVQAIKRRADDSDLELDALRATYLDGKDLENRFERIFSSDRGGDRGGNRGPKARPLPRMDWLKEQIDTGQAVPAMKATLANGTSYFILRRLPDPGPDLAWRPMLAIGLLAFMPLAIALWALYRLRQATMALGAAARRFGDDLEAPALRISGPAEVTQTVDAFNHMQGRIRSLMSERTRMLAAISHDLRTQLTKLRMRAEFITPEKQRDKAVADIERLDRLLSQVVQVARLDAGSEDKEPTAPVDVAAQIRALISDMRWQDQVSYLGPQSAQIETGRGTLERILSNLIENALRYGKKAEVGLAQSPKQVVISVEDFGPGIPETEIERVFEPFYRLESSRNLATGGSGLGLSIVKGLVEQLGGQISLSNLDRGGLRAQVTLPYDATNLGNPAGVADYAS